MSGSSTINYANPISRGRPCTHTELESRVILLHSLRQRVRDKHLKVNFAAVDVVRSKYPEDSAHNLSDECVFAVDQATAMVEVTTGRVLIGV